jgi:hypothetical protein
MNDNSKYFVDMLRKLKKSTVNGINKWTERIDYRYEVTFVDVNYNKEIFFPYIKFGRIIENKLDNCFYPYDNYVDTRQYPYIYEGATIEIHIDKSVYFPFYGSITIRVIEHMNDKHIESKKYSQSCWFIGKHILFSDKKLMNALACYAMQFVVEIGV